MEKILGKKIGRWKNSRSENRREKFLLENRREKFLLENRW